MRSKLFYKIFATYVILITVVIGVLEFFLTPAIRDRIVTELKEKLAIQGRLLATMSLNEIMERMDRSSSFTGARITLIDAAGQVVSDTGVTEINENHLHRSEIQQARLKGMGESIRYSTTMKEDTIYVAVTLREGDHIKGYVRLAKPLTAVREALEHLYSSIYLTLYIVSIPSLGLALFFAWTITAPVRRMAELTEKLRQGEKPGTLFMESSDEMGRLAENLNFILGELQEKIRIAQEEQARLEAAFGSMVEGVLELGQDNRIVRFNRSLGVMLGRRYKDIIGKTPMEAFRNPALHDALQRFHEGGVPVTQEIVLGGTPSLTLEVSITSFGGIAGQEDKVLMVFHDVTRLKKLERIRSDFIANVTHELRTPLTAILGYVETLREGAAEDPSLREKFLRTVENHARRLNGLIDDLLTLSEIESGHALFRMEVLNLESVLEDVLQAVREKARQKGLDIVHTVVGSVTITADRDRLYQIFLNVLDNAVKFTSAGRIEISIGEAEKAGFIAVRIKDTGTGIPASQIPRLGERFYRVDRDRSREQGGTGLGLSIVKHLMEAHGGKMVIESTLGVGTTVTLLFPAAAEA